MSLENDSDTPRTNDEITLQLNSLRWADYLSRLNRMIPFAEMLERENSALRSALQDCVKSLQVSDVCGPRPDTVEQAKKMKEK